MPTQEVYQYITADGKRYDFHAPNVRVLLSKPDGTGMPPIEYVTQRGPLQHGESLISYFLRPRTMQLLLRAQGCSRAQYWSSRADLIDYMRPNRHSPTSLPGGTLRVVQLDGTIRDIDCLIQQGPGFTAKDNRTWDEFSWQEVLRFIAFNPIAYDPTTRSLTYATPSGQLVFPITFPITFTSNEVITNVTYLGTWLEYPTFIITGPMTNPVIQNLTTNQKLQFDNMILNTGESVTVNLSYGVKTAQKNDGTNMVGYLSSDSNLGEFHLAPNPEATNGVNQIRISSSGGGGGTGIVMTYKYRYIGF